MFIRFTENFYFRSSDELVLDTQYADVNGDGQLEAVIVTGRKPYGESGFIEDITLTVRNDRTGVNIKVVPKENGGYSPTVLITNFTDDTTPQVYLSINSGGSGGYYFNYIYSFKNNITKQIFDSDVFSGESEFDAVYQDNYKVLVTSKDNTLKGIIDLTAIRDQDYLNQLYTPDGKLKEPQVGGVLALSYLSPYSLYGAKPFNLLTNQRIIGLYNADTLGAVETILQWDKDKFRKIVTRLVVVM